MGNNFFFGFIFRSIQLQLFLVDSFFFGNDEFCNEFFVRLCIVLKNDFIIIVDFVNFNLDFIENFILVFGFVVGFVVFVIVIFVCYY